MTPSARKKTAMRSKSTSDESISPAAKKLSVLFKHMLNTHTDKRVYIARFMRKITTKRRPSCFLRVLLQCVDAQTVSGATPVLASNLLALLRRLSAWIAKSDKTPKRNSDSERACADYDALWMKLLAMPMSRVLRRRILVLLSSQVLPRLAQPLCVTDFLMNSYEQGGIDSILALHGVFLLMHKHNLEYPDFYSKLYSLLVPNAVRTAHTARFFRLVDLFLTSSYLPLSLVAAFVKRLSRLSLTAPTPLVRPLVVLICNLLVRHPGLRRMCDDPRGSVQLPSSGDPYNYDAKEELERCGAMESCLWEVASLKQHVWPQAARSASFVGRGRVELVRSVDELWDSDYPDLINKELSRELNDIPLTFHRPQGLLMCAEDRLSETWTF